MPLKDPAKSPRPPGTPNKVDADGKRRLSSDGQTPKPTPKQVKMASSTVSGQSGRSSSSSSDKDYDKFIEKMTIIADAVDKLQKGQATLQSIVESRLDKFRNDFISSIEEKFKAMKSDLDLELSVHKAQIENLSQTIDSIVVRLDTVENQTRPIYGNRDQGFVSGNPLDDVNITIIASNVKCEPNEDPLTVARELVAQLDENVQIVAASRLKSRQTDKPGLLKISFASLDEKIRVLKLKRNLNDIEGYSSVFSAFV